MPCFCAARSASSTSCPVSEKRLRAESSRRFNSGNSAKTSRTASGSVASASRPRSAPQHSYGYVSAPCARILSAKWLLIQSVVSPAMSTLRLVLVPKAFVQVLGRGIRKNRDHHRAQLLRDPRGYGEATQQRSGRAGADEQAFFPRQALHQPIRVFRCDRQILIRELVIINRRHNRRGHVLPAFQAVEGRIGLQADAANFAIQFLQSPCRSDKSAAGAQPGHEMRNAARSLRPDFVRRSAVMRLPIRRIAVLVGVKIFVGLCRNNLVYLANRAVRALIARRDDQFRAIRLEDALALLRSAVRQAKLHGIPHRRANHGVGDTRVTAGGIKDGLAGSERAAVQPGLNHAQRGAGLYSPSGIEPFRVGIPIAGGELLARSLQPQQGRIPNAVEQSLAATARRSR